ncbi:DUF692 domain-containing protein [Tahibacter amnicola]|uniref:UPF0276 protein N4264_21415 n=1 Tax=Tahibacter amnicola TaxID=2976241 RepID=A0ABY6BHD6_9GAMM|nr:DUF692 domain-containing protein [Tahibacter amnicola]UXI67272.1 DUF692 domain-containing protein [Tahibacter amnicola]
MSPRNVPHGAGLGFRRALLGPLADAPDAPIDFFEIAPENWINVGGHLGRQLRQYTERYPFVCHGLSLSLGGPEPLDETLLHKIRRLLDDHGVAIYSEHLSYCSDDGHLYDLMPIPFTREAVDWVAARVRRAQDILGRRIAIENVSYYAAPGREMDEVDFVREVLEAADCLLLLDVNNIHVNSVNHGYDANAFLDAMPGDRIAYYHIAGHYDEEPGLKVDTHGSDVIAPVWQLLERAYQRFGVRPTLLERDFNIPPLADLVTELDQIRRLQSPYASPREVIRHAASR